MILSLLAVSSLFFADSAAISAVFGSRPNDDAIYTITLVSGGGLGQSTGRQAVRSNTQTVAISDSNLPNIEFRVRPAADGTIRIEYADRFWALVGDRIQLKPGVASATRFRLEATNQSGSGPETFQLKPVGKDSVIGFDSGGLRLGGLPADLAFSAVRPCTSSPVVWLKNRRANLASGKPTRQSSIFESGGGRDTANRGVDNDVCGRLAQTKVETNAVPFWEVDLGAVKNIEALLVYRGNPVMDGAVIATSSTVNGDALMFASPAVQHYRMTNQKLTLISVPAAVKGHEGPRPDQARHIRIFHPRKRGQISLSEVVVIGQ